MGRGRWRLPRPALLAVATALVATIGCGLALAGVTVRDAGGAPARAPAGSMGLAGAALGEVDPPMGATTSPQAAPVAPSSTGAPTTVPPPSPARPRAEGSSTVPPAVVVVSSSTPPTRAGRPVAPPGAPPAPTSNGTGTWKEVSNGISIELRMEPLSPRAGETVRFTITASHPTEYCCVTSFYAGDGTSVPPVMDPSPCPAAQPSMSTRQVEHVYDRAGTFTVGVQPSAFGFCTPGPPAVVNGRVDLTIVVAP